MAFHLQEMSGGICEGATAYAHFGRQNGDQVGGIQGNSADSSSSSLAPPPQPEPSGQGMVAATSLDPSPALPTIGSDKAERGMVAAISRGAAPCHAPDHPKGEAPIATKEVAPPEDTGGPVTSSINHVANATSMDTIIIDDHGGKDTAQAVGPKPGILANEKIAGESNHVVKSKNAPNFDTSAKKDSRKGRRRKRRTGARTRALPNGMTLTARSRTFGVKRLREWESRKQTQRMMM